MKPHLSFLGGLSFLSNRYGWGCDNILSYDIVLPSGEVTAVNEKWHRDLYRALRGVGSANFGIVTSFELETVKSANPNGFWWSSKMADFNYTPTILNEQHKLYTEGLASDLDAGFIHTVGYLASHDIMLAAPLQVHTSHRDLSITPKVFTAFDAVKSSQEPDLGIVPMSNISYKLFDLNPPPGKRNIYGTFTAYPSREFEGRYVEMAEATFKSLKSVPGFFGGVVMQPIYGNARKLMSKRGGNALGLASEDSSLNIVLQSWQWSNSSDDALIYRKVEELITAGENLAQEMKVYHPYKYINYAEEWQDVFSGLGEKNLKGLRKLQRKYDPEEIFTKGGLCGGYFKLNEKQAKQENRSKDEL